MSRARWTLAAATGAIVAACNAIWGIAPPDAVRDAGGDDVGVLDAPEYVDATPDATDAGAEVDACAADLMTDKHNCGRCGHDCLGGDCAGGACQPYLVLSLPDTPTSVAVAGSTLYVTAFDQNDATSGHVLSCAVDACKATKSDMATGLRSPWFAQVSGSTLFWTNAGSTDDAGNVTTPGSVAGCPTGGCADAGPTVYTTGAGQLTGVASDSTSLYWGDLGTGLLNTCARASCAVVPLSPSGPNLPYGVALGAQSQYVYWTDPANVEVFRCALPSCNRNPDVFAPSQLYVQNLAAHAGNVYWTIDDSVTGEVRWCPEAGCGGGGPRVLAANQRGADGIAADDSGIYWTAYNDRTVMYCPSAPCAQPVALATSQPALYAIALDAVSVYFTNSSAAGNVMRVAKP